MDRTISKGNLVFTILEIIDLIHPNIMEDVIKTSYLVWKTTEALSLSKDIQAEAVAASLLSVIGCIKNTSPEISRLQECFDTSLVMTTSLLSTYSPFNTYVVLYSSDTSKDLTIKDIIPNAIKVIDYLKQTPLSDLTSLDNLGIPKKLASYFLTILKEDQLHHDFNDPFLEQLIYNGVHWVEIPFNLVHLEQFSLFLLSLLSLKKPSIALHSYTAGEIAELLAKNEGLSESQSTLIKLSSYLQHLGKIGVPNDILEKGSPLSHHEKALLHNSPYFTFKMLKHIDIYKEIIIWASFNHRSSDLPKRKATTLEIDIIHLSDVYVTLRNIHQESEGTIDEVIRQLQKKAGIELSEHLIYALKRQLGKIESVRQLSQEKAESLLFANTLVNNV